MLVPDGGDRETYPVLLALPPGPQAAGQVEWAWSNYYRDAGLKRGWVVVCPVGPGGKTFPEAARPYLLELLAEVAKTYPPEGSKFHVSGVSNGGLSAFRIALLRPDLFHSIAVLPGWPLREDLADLGRIAQIPIRMWAGENERPSWLDLMRQTEVLVRDAGGDVELIVLPGEGHTLGGLIGGEAVFEFLGQVRGLR